MEPEKKVKRKPSKNETQTIPIVIITVPHSTCLNWAFNSGHFCDPKALQAAKAIDNCLKNYRIHVEFFPDKNIGEEMMHRSIYDENRKNTGAMESRVRKRLKDYIEKNRANIKFAIDVHSYPPEDKNITKDLDMYVLDTDYGDEGEKPYYVQKTDEFIREVRKTSEGIKIDVYEGAKENYLEELFRNAGIQSFLLEVNEILSDREIEQYACEAAQIIYEVYIKNAFI